MRKTFLIILPFVFIAVTIFAAAIFIKKEQAKRKYHFDTLFPLWVESQYQCDDTNFFQEILKITAPDILADIKKADLYFSTLEIKEKKGTLTVAERENYLSHKLSLNKNRKALINRGWITESLSKKSDEDVLIKHCPKETYIYFNKGKVTGFCFGRAKYDLEFVWPLLSNQYYSYLNDNEKLNRFLQEISMALSKDETYKKKSNSYVGHLMSSEVTTDQIPDKEYQIYLRLKCKLDKKK